jgi:hypothetical protein
MKLKHHRLVSVRKGRLTRKTFEQHAPQRIEVAAAVYVRQRRDLFGTHVGGCANRYAGPGQLIGARGDYGTGDPEIE